MVTICSLGDTLEHTVAPVIQVRREAMLVEDGVVEDFQDLERSIERYSAEI